MATNVPYITRNIDDLGRVVIPKEIRYRLNLLAGDEIGIIPREDGILLVPVKKSENIRQEISRLAEVIGETYPVKTLSDERKRNALVERTKSLINLLDDIPEDEDNLLIE